MTDRQLQQLAVSVELLLVFIDSRVLICSRHFGHDAEPANTSSSR